MNDNKDKQEPVQVDEKSVKKPDSAAGLLVEAHLKISDPETGRVLLKTRG